jgi:hypothetical protein
MYLNIPLFLFYLSWDFNICDLISSAVWKRKHCFLRLQHIIFINKRKSKILLKYHFSPTRLTKTKLLVILVRGLENKFFHVLVVKCVKYVSSIWQ